MLLLDYYTLSVPLHRLRRNIRELCEHPVPSSSELLDIWRSENPSLNSHFVRQLLVAVVRATFRFHDTTPQGKLVYNLSWNHLSHDFKTKGRIINRFGKVRLNFQFSAMISDSRWFKGYINY